MQLTNVTIFVYLDFSDILIKIVRKFVVIFGVPLVVEKFCGVKKLKGI